MARRPTACGPLDDSAGAVLTLRRHSGNRRPALDRARELVLVPFVGRSAGVVGVIASTTSASTREAALLEAVVRASACAGTIRLGRSAMPLAREQAARRGGNTHRERSTMPEAEARTGCPVLGYVADGVFLVDAKEWFSSGTAAEAITAPTRGVRHGAASGSGWEALARDVTFASAPTASAVLRQPFGRDRSRAMAVGRRSASEGRSRSVI
jgi:hypothetical protein